MTTVNAQCVVATVCYHHVYVLMDIMMMDYPNNAKNVLLNVILVQIKLLAYRAEVTMFYHFAHAMKDTMMIAN